MVDESNCKHSETTCDSVKTNKNLNAYYNFKAMDQEIWKDYVIFYCAYVSKNGTFEGQ
jgi:hypothetical protein